MSTATKINCEIRLDMSELLSIEANLMSRAEEIISKCAFLVEGKAKSKAPVDTGALKNSIYTSLYRSSAGAGYKLPIPDSPLIAYVGPTVDYGIYVEFGTYKMAAQPYLWPAVVETNTEFLRIWRQLVIR